MWDNKNRKFILIIVIGIAFLITFNLGFSLGETNGEKKIVCKTCPPEDVDFSIFWEAWNKIEKEFINGDALKRQEMIYGAISGMVKSLDDPYTVFLKPEDNKKFLEDVSGSFEGIGIEIGIKKKQLQVISVLEGTPAEKAGLRAGDKIIKINDNLTSDLTIDEAVSLIRGKKGTEVSLSIFRDDWDSIKEIKIIRDRINIPSIKWELKEGDIAYIKINQFSAKSDYDFLKTAIEILNSPAKKIILDLRNNPGGYLEVAVDMAGWFLKKGDTVVIEDFKNDKDDVVYKAKGNSKFLNYPIVVLINNSSASAAEILAAALQENRNIKLIGEKSFGKGSVQKIEELSDKSALKITVANWLTPKGKVISKEGLTPDIKVEMTEEDYQNKRDPQLDKAIEIIKNIM